MAAVDTQILSSIQDTKFSKLIGCLRVAWKLVLSLLLFEPPTSVSLARAINLVLALEARDFFRLQNNSKLRHSFCSSSNNKLSSLLTPSLEKQAKMSYAAAAAKGPKQTPEEARAPAVPEIENTESLSSSSLIDVDSASVHTVPSDFGSQEIQTSTQMDRLEHDALAAEARAKEEMSAAAAKAKKEGKEAKEKAKKAAGYVDRNSDNPVFIANAVAVVGLSLGLGFGAYRKYAGGELSWKVVGVWTGVVGLFAAGDYYLSQYMLRTRYPPKN